MNRAIQKSAILISLLLLLISWSAPGLACNIMRASGPPIWPPFVEPMTGGKLRSGIAIDTVREAFAGTDVHLVVENARPWNRVLRDLEIGEIDLVFAIMDSPERRKKYVFSAPWTDDVYAAVTLVNRGFSWSGIEDFKGKRGARFSGGRVPEPFDRVTAPVFDMAQIGSVPSLYRMLRFDRVDYLIVSLPSFQALLPAGESPAVYSVVPGTEVSIPVYMAFSRHSDCARHLDKLNSFLSEVYERSRHSR